MCACFANIRQIVRVDNCKISFARNCSNACCRVVVSCLFICTNRNSIEEKRTRSVSMQIFCYEKRKGCRETVFFFKRIEAKMESRGDERRLLLRK